MENNTTQMVSLNVLYGLNGNDREAFTCMDKMVSMSTVIFITAITKKSSNDGHHVKNRLQHTTREPSTG